MGTDEEVKTEESTASRIRGDLANIEDLLDHLEHNVKFRANEIRLSLKKIRELLDGTRS